MPEPTPFTLETPNGPLHGLVDLPEAPGERPAVVLCHGFKGFMEWGFFPYLAALLAARGFAAVRVEGELTGLLTGLDATGGEIASGRVDPSRLGLFGHGRGGAAAVLAAARPEWRDRLGALVTWAAGEIQDDVSAAAPRVAAPWLILHGEADETVPVAEGDLLYELARGPKKTVELLRIPGAGHTLGAAHPFTGPNPHLIQALNATQRWLRRHLS